jgi:hypothetical protein
MEVYKNEEMPPLTDAQAVSLYLLVTCGDDWRKVLRAIGRMSDHTATQFTSPNDV